MHSSLPLPLGAILGGGQSRRMGRDKASLVRPDGRTQQQFAVDLLLPFTSAIVVSVAATSSPATNVEALSKTVRLVPDQLPQAGPLMGIASCLRYATTHTSAPAVFFLPVDLPAITAADLQTLVDRYHANPECITVASDPDGRLQPLLSIWPTKIADAAQAAALGDQRSVYKLVLSLPHAQVSLPATALQNTNTWDEWNAWYQHGNDPGT